MRINSLLLPHAADTRERPRQSFGARAWEPECWGIGYCVLCGACVAAEARPASTVVRLYRQDVFLMFSALRCVSAIGYVGCFACEWCTFDRHRHCGRQRATSQHCVGNSSHLSSLLRHSLFMSLVDACFWRCDTTRYETVKTDQLGMCNDFECGNINWFVFFFKFVLPYYVEWKIVSVL